MERVKIFPYVIAEEVPIEQLSKFSNHRRLQTFFHKGCVCVSCGRVGTRLIRGYNKSGKSYHWDVYTDDLIPLSVDHIIPRSLGGPDELENYQPMCSPCNSRKGNGEKRRSRKKSPKDKPFDFTDYITYDPEVNCIGKELWRFLKKNGNAKYLGVINHISPNPFTGVISFEIIKNGRSSYHHTTSPSHLIKVK